MKTSWISAILIACSVALALAPTLADAKRFGGARSFGMQRNMPARTAPDAPPPKPAAPNQAAPTAPAGTAAATGGAAAKRSWMGPIAGLAAGLGIAALMSHLGLSEAFGNFLVLALLALAAVFLVRFLVRFLMRRRSGTPALAGAGSPLQRYATQVAWPSAAPAGGATGTTAPSATPAPAPPAVTAADPVARAFVPAAFDSEGFERTAKTLFVRLQAAHDSGDLNDIRRYTTPEMFAELQMDVLERGRQAQHTQVVRVDAAVLDVADDGLQQIVSVRFHGLAVESEGQPAEAFDEVWHLVKPHDDSRSWAIAGIEQQAVS